MQTTMARKYTRPSSPPSAGYESFFPHHTAAGFVAVGIGAQLISLRLKGSTDLDSIYRSAENGEPGGDFTTCTQNRHATAAEETQEGKRWGIGGGGQVSTGALQDHSIRGDKSKRYNSPAGISANAFLVTRRPFQSPSPLNHRKQQDF